MTVHEQEVRPTIIVEVKKHSAPAEVLSVRAKSSSIGDVGKRPVSAVVIERRSVVRKVCAEQIEASVTIIVGDGRTHAGLLATIGVVGDTRQDADVCKRPVSIIMIKNAGSAVASHVDVRPAIIVIVKRRNAETIVP